MSARTWIGASSDQAADPNNWSPTGAPQPGDSLIWDNGGTMDVTGNALAGDTLRLGGTSSSPQDYVVNVSGRAHFTEATAFPPIGLGSVTVNLADHAQWIGGFSTNLAGGVFITGDGTFANHSSLVAARSVVDVDVVGRGSFFVSSAQSVPGDLEFTKSVSKGQSITVGGDPTRGVHATLVVDDSGDFHAATTLGFGEVVLGGLKADSYTMTKGDLVLYAGAKVVDRLDLTVNAAIGARNFGVDQTAGGIVIHADVAVLPGGTPLSMHG